MGFVGDLRTTSVAAGAHIRHSTSQVYPGRGRGRSDPGTKAWVELIVGFGGAPAASLVRQFAAFL
eukprot:7240480-Alexandrium_andersonii.AAC.1